ncbi:TPA: tyrosine-type recombinase/integrase [Salmonella enterica subsp. enterica serovar 4,5,12:b:-]|nr:tyrosine-type recombinase/integrase [Salmonella enterica]
MMVQNKLNDKELRALLTRSISKQETHADGLGLSLRVSPSKVGKRNNLLWMYRYRLGDRTTSPVALVLGKYPDLSLAGAREMRDQCRTWLAEGRNPRDAMNLKRESTLKPLTVKDALEYWLTSYAEKHRSNAEKHRQQFAKWVYPRIGDLPLAELTTRDWLSLFNEYSAVAPVASGYCFGNCKQALKYCRKHGLTSDMIPAKGSYALDDLTITDVGKKQGKRERTLTDGELSDVFNWTRDIRYPRYYREMLYLLLIYGSRTQELRLSNISAWGNGKWIVPKEHSKGRNKIVRPIPDFLREYLDSLKERKSDSNLLLIDEKKSEAVSQWGRTLWKRLGHNEPWTLHDLRRTFATRLTGMGVAPHIVEALLGHVLPGVMAHYIHAELLPEKTEALELWYKFLTKISYKTE